MCIRDRVGGRGCGVSQFALRRQSLCRVVVAGAGSSSAFKVYRPGSPHSVAALLARFGVPSACRLPAAVRSDSGDGHGAAASSSGLPGGCSGAAASGSAAAGVASSA
eukprot:4765763-Alexandrium_andersonii.AAC.1